jgi:diadenosine tetraphosphatase ApaH/serine/threonine PP2A family protein phosphatase
LEVERLGRILVCHGSPRTDMEILTERTPTPRLREAVAEVEQEVVICGHTHMQFDRTAGGRRVVNPGSVGLPYEGRPGAYWAILGPDVAFKRTEYDVESAADLIRGSGYPNVEEFIAEYIVGSHDREEAMEFFEKLALDDPRFAGG